MTSRSKRSRTVSEVTRLVENVNPRARIPKGFGLWTTTMQIMWLKQHQKKESEK